MPGEMAGEKRFVNTDRFHADAFGFAFEAEDTVDHEERIAVRQNCHDLVDIETAFARWESLRLKHRRRARKFPGQRAHQLGVRAMAGLNRDDVTANSLPEEC